MNSVENFENLAGKYDLIINGYDWGPGADKAIIYCADSVSQKKIKPEDFSVAVTIQMVKWGAFSPSLTNSTGKRVVTAAYLCNSDGSKSDEAKGNYIALEMSVSPSDPYCNPFVYSFDMMNHWQKDYKLAIHNEKLNLSIYDENKRICPLADQFSTGKSTTGSVTLNYGAWQPESSKKNPDAKFPLIIWLHGMGEGGQDPYIALLGNKVVNLITPTVQNSFGESGAWVLVPQVDGFWMQTKQNSKDMKDWVSDKNEKVVSCYTEALFALIDNFVKENPQIDKNRIYIGGCSNGGYMTVNMLIEYPDYFAAAYPVCEAYPDSKITEEKLKLLLNQHIWFTQSKDDKTVIPENFTLPTYKRLIEAGAKDVHLSLWDSVTDQTGLFKDEKGKPFKYNGHFSWLYALNNQCSIDGISIFQWMAGIHR